MCVDTNIDIWIDDSIKRAKAMLNSKIRGVSR